MSRVTAMKLMLIYRYTEVLRICRRQSETKLNELNRAVINPIEPDKKSTINDKNGGN